VRRFEPRKEGRSTVTLFRQPPKPQFRTVAYNRAPVRLLYALVPADGASGFHPIAQERAGDIAKAVRDRAAARLRGELRDRAAEIERVIVGRDAGPAELERRVRFLPLPSIGMAHTDPAIRRIVVEVPPDCPIDADTLGWAISGQSPGIDPQTGEVVARWLENAVLAPAADDRMLSHFGFGRAARRWQSVTPVALPPGRRRGRLKGSERAEDEQRAAAAVATALRHAGHAWRGVDIRVQAEPFFAKGARAEAFEPADADMRGRFAGRLSHVEVTFPEPVAGPLVIGDGRFLGLGLMAPVREGPPSLHLFSVDPAIAPLASAGEAVARALRRAVMARADAQWRSRYAGGRGGEALPLLFTGHEPDGQPARSGRHEHLFFLAEDADGDGRIDRLAVIAPHRVDRSPESDPEKQRELARHLRLLDRALAGLALLRAGRAGVLRLSRIADTPGDQDGVFGRARVWVSRTPYRLTRHPRRTSVEEAVRLDILQECSRRGLPRPAVDVLDIDVGPQERAAARVRLHFRTAVEGPLLLGRGSHFGAGEFAWQE
jgi:CRISPR-associated protein Csb2